MPEAPTPLVDQSILDTIKKSLGLEADYTPYDAEIVMHINSVFLSLQQLNVGSDRGFAIEGKEETWRAFFEGDDPNLNAVKTYIYLRVRLLFDPPGNSFAQESFNKQLKELEWRLIVYTEGVDIREARAR